MLPWTIDFLIPARMGQHCLLDLLHIPQPRPEDVAHAPVGSLQFLDRLLADHAAVGDDHDSRDAEPSLESVDHGNQCFDVCRVARPDFTADGPAQPIQDGRHDHLHPVGSMVFAVPVLSDRLAAFAFEVQGRGVEEDQLQIAEHVTPPVEQGLFDQVLRASRGEGRGTTLVVLRQGLTQPGHCPI